MLAGAAVLLLAGVAMVLTPTLAATPETAGASATASSPQAGASSDASGGPAAAALSTSNVRARPDAGADVVAVAPGERRLQLLGQTLDGTWLRVAYPEGSDVQGWLPASRVALTPELASTLPRLDVPPPAPAAEGAMSGERLPDLAVTGASVLADGRLSVEISNRGTAPLLNASIPLHVSKASGEILGVLEVGPTSLAAGGSATVVTPVVVLDTATVQLALDLAGTIAESDDSNNAMSVLLVAGGG